jgi:hypothetical protein
MGKSNFDWLENFIEAFMTVAKLAFIASWRKVM